MSQSNVRNIILSNFPKAQDPLLRILMNSLGLAPLTIAFLFFVLFGGIIASASFIHDIASFNQLMETLLQQSHVLLGYPLFVFNVFAACLYCRNITDAVAEIFDPKFMFAEDWREIELTINSYFLKSHKFILIKNILIYIIVFWVVANFHFWLYMGFGVFLSKIPSSEDSSRLPRRLRL